MTTPRELVKFVNILIYAEPGGGKTHFAGTSNDSPNTSPYLAIDIDGGMATLLKRWPDTPTKPLRSIRELQTTYDELAKSVGQPDFPKTISLDNLSELQKLDMNTVMVDTKNTAQNPDKVDIYVPSQREWGKSSERMRIIIRAFRDLPCNTIMLAHYAETKDERTGVVKMHPSLPGKLKNELAGFFDIVGFLKVYTENGEVKREIQFAKTDRVAAKDRFDVLPQLMKDNPTFPQIYDTVLASRPEIPNDAASALLAAVVPT